MKNVFRASEIFRLMAYLDKSVLPDGALSLINEKASKIILDWDDDLNVSAMKKGIECEQDSIDLLNFYLDKKYKKNADRITTDCLTGEADIIDKDESLVIDVKTAWSKKTFPFALKSDDKKMYEWQLRAYMHLYDVNNAKLVYCLVDTPPHLINYEPADWHEVSHIDMNRRIAITEYSRDLIIEEKMMTRIALAHKALELLVGKYGIDLKNMNEDENIVF